MPETTEQIFDAFPSVAEFAREVAEKYKTVHSWKSRGVIPAEADGAVILALKRQGVAMTYEQMARIRKVARGR